METNATIVSKHGINSCCVCLLFYTGLTFILERQIVREKVGEMLSEKIMYVAENMNRHEYTPKMPSQSDLDLIFDTSYSDVQPYLHKVLINSNLAANL